MNEYVFEACPVKMHVSQFDSGVEEYPGSTDRYIAPTF